MATSTLLWLVRTIIFHDPTSNYLFRGDRRALGRVPRHKSLFGVEPGRGLPIGNLTSQFFAAVYLDRLDQFVKHTLKARRYVRYVDDFVIVEPVSTRFDEYTERIDAFLRDDLKLEIKPEAIRRGRVSDGIDFLGYIKRPSHTLVRRRVVNNFKRRLLDFERVLVQRSADRTVYRCDSDVLERLRAVLNGYFAHFAHADARRLSASIPTNNVFLGVYFRFHGDQALRRYTVGRAFANFSTQVIGLGGPREAVGELVIVRVGEFYELYGKSAAWAAEHLGLKQLGPRRGMRRRAGFHHKMLSTYLDRALAAGKAAAIVEEENERIGGLKVRRLHRIVAPRTKENHEASPHRRMAVAANF